MFSFFSSHLGMKLQLSPFYLNLVILFPRGSGNNFSGTIWSILNYPCDMLFVN